MFKVRLVTPVYHNAGTRVEASLSNVLNSQCGMKLLAVRFKVRFLFNMPVV